MTTDLPQPIRLENYQPPSFLVDTVDLTVRLHATSTRVTCRLAVRPNPLRAQTMPAVSGDSAPADGPLAGGHALVLDGEDLRLEGVELNGTALGDGDYTYAGDKLTIQNPPDKPFTITTHTTCDPESNTQLSGLYRSGGIFCTQCEAEGFRRFAFMLDRPDVLAIYTTRIEADAAEAPVLLANGNPVDSGVDETAGTHFAVWHDPHPKPAYLFALVGGELACVRDTFTTASGRVVELRIYVEPGKEGQCGWAMDSLKRSMRWDETRFGREYDLDIFMIVAVSDFNMGAMENKGLNIFNDKLILATPDTATDANYEAIESVVAHEYFHNWTGNRITCRDWFQLCLKQGLTVFRDQEFSSDERARDVQRIADVMALRAVQFPEDAGPLAHPVRPEQFIEINNFYTATVYVKGAELCRMLFTMAGRDGFRSALDLYFERHDGEAATVEDFLACFRDTCAIDTAHFLDWYRQAGTPRVDVERGRSGDGKDLTLTLSQSTPATPGETEKKSLPIPVLFGLVDPNGDATAVASALAGATVADIDLPRRTGEEAPHTPADGAPVDATRMSSISPCADGALLVLRTGAARVTLPGAPRSAVPSLLRTFSAPVKLSTDLSDDDLTQLTGHDSDSFNRWEAAQTVAKRLLLNAVASRHRADAPLPAADKLADAIGRTLDDTSLSDAFKALMLALPGLATIIQEIGADVDPDAVADARRAFALHIAAALSDRLSAITQNRVPKEPYRPDAAAVGQRALVNAALGLQALPETQEAFDRAAHHYHSATNMTDRYAALAATGHFSPDMRQPLLDDALARWQDNPLLTDKWLALQASATRDGVLDTVKALTGHPTFSLRNPNKVRALIGTFANANPAAFHAADGSGYAFVAEQIVALDNINTQVAARLANAFGTWRMMEAGRRAHAQAALERIAAKPALSKDVQEMVGRMLA